MISKEDFHYAFERGYDGIVMYKEIDGDMDTPVSLLSKMMDSRNMFLLESAKEDKTYSRFSFLSFDLDEPITINTNSLNEDIFKGKNIFINENYGDFRGGYVGYFAYESVVLFDILRKPVKKLPNKLGLFFYVDRFLVYDNYTDRLFIGYLYFFNHDLSEGKNFNNAVELMENFEKKVLDSKQNLSKKSSKPRIKGSMFSKEEFMDNVKRVKSLIEEGEIIQTVISNFFDVENLNPFEFYRNLRRINPSPYMYFVKSDNFYIVGSSPEIHIRKRGSIATIKPIAGTKPKGETKKETNRLKEILANDEKERAEHLMLVDLARNDLGRVSKKDSVEVKTFMQPEEYSHVIHLVSEVVGELRDDVSVFELVANTFPAGTLSGAPKVRAIEIIDETETHARGAYGGCVGYIGFDSNVDMAITIRTAIFMDKTARLQAGAGIVYDSDPASEYYETINKLKALLRAGGIYDNFD